MAFSFRDDPFSTINPPTTPPDVKGDTVTYTFSAENESGTTLPDVSVWIPFAEPRLPILNGVQGKGHVSHEALPWNNQMHGWFTPHFIDENGKDDGGLLITAQINGNDTPPDAPTAGQVANASGKQQFPLSSKEFLNVGGASHWPVETISPNDLLPLAHLGSIAPGPDNAKAFTVSFTAHWLDHENGPVRVGGHITTLVPNDTSSPSGGTVGVGGVTIDG